MYIRADDTVEIITGNQIRHRAKVLRVLAKENKLIVEGVNRVYKHMRRSQRNPQGGRLSKEMPVNQSNVMLVCPSCSQRTRVGARVSDDGGKERYCKKCGTGIGVISPPRASRAKGQQS